MSSGVKHSRLNGNQILLPQKILLLFMFKCTKHQTFQINEKKNKKHQLQVAPQKRFILLLLGSHSIHEVLMVHRIESESDL